MRYVLLLLALISTSCLRREPPVPDSNPPYFIPDSLTKYEPYQNVELYEYRHRWLLPDSYSKVQVPVTKPGRLDALFTEERELYRKEGESYKPYKVLVVRMEEYRKKEIRRSKMQDTMQFWFLLGAGIGVLCIVGGVIAKYYQQPYWDELVITGVVVACFGLAGAWWVEELPYIAGIGAVCMLGIMGYSIWRKRVLCTNHDAVELETATVVEQLKMIARPAWEKVKPTITHSAETKAMVAKAKDKAKAIAADRVADLVETVRIQRHRSRPYRVLGVRHRCLHLQLCHVPPRTQTFPKSIGRSS